MFMVNMGCNQKAKKLEPFQNQPDTLVDEKAETVYLKERKKRLPYGFERSTLNKGDSIMIYGGDSSYIKNHFGFDTLHGRIIKRGGSKSSGTQSFLRLQNAKPNEGVFAISEYYWDSKRGYNEARLSIWERYPTESDQQEASRRSCFMIHHFDVETGIRFKKLK